MGEIEQTLGAASSASVGFIEPLKAESPRDVLEEIFGLLEEYGPTWYSEELHNRAEAAILKGSTSPVDPHSK